MTKEIVQKERADALLDAADLILNADGGKDTGKLNKAREKLKLSNELKQKVEGFGNLDPISKREKLLDRANEILEKSGSKVKRTDSPPTKEIRRGEPAQPPHVYGDELGASLKESQEKAEAKKKAAEEYAAKYRDYLDNKMTAQAELAEKVANGEIEFDSMAKFYESVSKYKKVMSGRGIEAAVEEQKREDEDGLRSHVRIKVGTKAESKKLEIRRQELEDRRLEDLKSSRKGDLIVFTSKQREDSRKAIEKEISDEFLEVLYGETSNPAVYVQRMAESILYQTKHLLDIIELWPELNSCQTLVANKGKAKLEFNSIEDAEAEGFSVKGITNCLNKKTKTHKGYRWKWATKTN